MANEIASSDDLIDSRDATVRIDELEDERQGLVDAIDEAETKDEKKSAKEEVKDFDESCEGEELVFLKELKEETENYGWEYGITFINEDYFEDYARQTAEDCCEGNFDSWPNTCIDWEQAGEELKQDYTTVDIQGQTFYYRA